MKTHEIFFDMTRRMVLLLVFLAAHSLAFTQPEPGNDKTLSPYFFVKSADASLDQLPLLSTRADVSIAGIIAGVKVTQVYKNDGSRPIEATYVFPASTRAAVHRMRMTIGERVIEAVIRERGQARQEYEQARSAGQGAALLEQQRPNVFQMNVANIMPGDRITVELEYAELLVPEKGEYAFVFPTVVGPRYSNTPLASASPREQWVANPFTRQGQPPGYTFDLHCMLNAGIPIAGLRVTSHEADIRYMNQEQAVINLKEKDKGNKDFIMQYRLSGKALESGLLLYEGKEENFFLAMVQPPEQVKPEMLPPREYVLIVDVSGSMHGFPLNVSKALFRELLGKLRPADYFNILLFAGGSQVFSEKSMPATAENIRSGIRFIENQSGGGGTELLPALQRALTLGSGEGMARTFIIATDGYVTVEQESFRLIREKLGEASFFAFGIGTAVNRYLIEGIAHAGMGETFIVTQESEADEVAARFREYVESPVLTDIKVSYKGITAYDVEPYSVPDVFSGRPVIVFGKYKGRSEGATISLRGRTGTGEYNTSLAFAQAGGSADNGALRSLWARERIRNLDDFGGSSRDTEAGSVEKQVTALGLKYNLLTQYTSFVAIDKDIRNKTGQSSTVAQPLPLPEGVSDYAVGGVVTSSTYAAPANGNTKNIMILGIPTMEDKRYNSGKNKSERAADKSLSEEATQIFTVAEEMPSFPGGEAALKKYLSEKLVYPASAKAKGIAGTVIVSFTVMADGRIADVSVLRGIGAGCDEAAIRAVKAMPRWKPGKQGGKAVKCLYSLPITFQ